MTLEGPTVTCSDSTGAVSLSRQRAQQAVEYYNGNLRAARIAANQTNNARRRVHNIHQQETLYRSNSSLELVPDRDLCSESGTYRQHCGYSRIHQHRRNCENSSPIDTRPGVLRREYGSHGSIDVLSTSGSRTGATTGESFFAMLKDYRPAVLGAIGTDQRSPGPTEYLRVKASDVPNELLSTSSSLLGVDSSLSNQESDAPPPSLVALHRISLPCSVQAATSPKLKHKLQRLWGGSQMTNNNVNGCMVSSPCKMSSNLSGVVNSSSNCLPGDDSMTNTSSSVVVASSSPDMEERQRRRAFAHYDCQSLTVNLGYAAKLRGLLLARRRNTTTGASAASMTGNNRTNTLPDQDVTSNDNDDTGDGRSNELIQACPYFRNEIGGEQEREVSLSRLSGPDGPHLPAMAYGVSVLESPAGGCTLWRGTTCPYQRLPRPIETQDAGALYYRHYFYGREHQNWFGLDEQLGPLAVSIRRERSEGPETSTPALFRLVVRTSELLTLRGAVFEDAVPGPTANKGGTLAGTKEVLEYVAPELQLSCLRLGMQTQQCEEQLLKLDEQGLTSRYKVGIMYCKAGQGSEEDMYNNQESGPAFDEFLDTIGKRVRLKGFDKYRAGLDNKTDSTGTHSIYAVYQDCEVMFHVSTLLPFTPNNRQQLLRKRHIGNDIVTIVFQEPDALPFTPKHIRSQFQHVFIVVRVINPCTDNTHYAVAVSRSKEVPMFGPPIKEGGIYPKGKSFVDLLLAKAINAENAAHRSEKFATMATRTRQEYLKDLANNYSTSTLVDTGQKFSLFSSIFPTRPNVVRPPYVPSARQRGATCWQVLLQDPGRPCPVDCLLGISADTFVLLEEATRRIVFVTPCKSILGWSTTNQSSGLRVYHHQGECVTLRMRGADDRSDEQTEITARLRVVTPGHLAQELALRRNSSGQLGFHVQPDGVVTQVESNGLAWSAGLRQGARLVEICKVAVATLTHDQMVDLLKTSVLVTVTVIPPHLDGSSRRGCVLQNCKYTAGYYECDYENMISSSSSTLSNPDEDSVEGNNFIKSVGHKKGAQMQLKSNHRRKYERSFSPPRSSNSSGYGTGSSSKSFSNDSRFPINQERAMSSIHSDPKWYEVLEPSSEQITHSKTPSPVTSSQNFQNGTPKHHKLQTSNSLSLQPANFTVGNAIEFENTDDITVKGYSSETSRPMPRTANIEYLHTVAKNETQSTDTILDSSLIASSSNSPHLKRSSKHRGTLTSRSVKQNIHPETKLRNGATSRYANRHSANLNSTLQEDLMRLINPDYSPEESLSKKKESCSMVNISAITDSKNKQFVDKSGELLPQSLSNLSMKDNEMPNDGTVAEVIFTMARPATVISNTSTASSPNPYEMKLSKEERLSPRATIVAKSASAGQIHLLKNLMVDSSTLSDDQDMDWPSLVDTANRAMLQVKEDSGSSSLKDTSRSSANRESQHCENNVIAHSASVPELKNHLNQLESRVVRETQQRLTLEDEVRRLREENRRLQDESQTAAQQLQRFTEWFFHTIHRN